MTNELSENLTRAQKDMQTIITTARGLLDEVFERLLEEAKLYQLIPPPPTGIVKWPIPQPSWDYKQSLTSNVVTLQNGGVVRLKGTQDNPIFITASTPITNRTVLFGEWCIVDGITFEDKATLRIAPGHHVAIRNCDFSGNLTRTFGIEISTYSNDVDNVSDIVVYKNTLHDFGYMTDPGDQDATAVSIGGKTSNIWVIENEIYNTSGSGLQICGGKGLQYATNHIYVIGNNVHHCRQSGLAAKQSSDVVFAYNHCHDIIDTPWSVGKGLGYQYAPERVWFIGNRIDNCTFGIFGGSDSGMGTGKNIYIVDNALTNIGISSGEYNPNTAWSAAAIMVAGGTYLTIIGNQMTDVDAGINAPNHGDFYLYGNTVEGLRPNRGQKLFIERGNVLVADPDEVKLLFESLYGKGE